MLLSKSKRRTYVLPPQETTGMGFFEHPVMSEKELAVASVTCIVAGFGLCFFSYR